MRIQEINFEHFSQGRYEPFPDELERLAMDPYLSATKKEYSDSVRDQLVMYGLDSVKFEIEPFYDQIGAGSDVVLRSCSDYTGVLISRHGQENGRGALLYQQIHFKYDGAQLKLIGVKSDQADKCTLK